MDNTDEKIPELYVNFYTGGFSVETTDKGGIRLRRAPKNLKNAMKPVPFVLRELGSDLSDFEKKRFSSPSCVRIHEREYTEYKSMKITPMYLYDPNTPTDLSLVISLSRDDVSSLISAAQILYPSEDHVIISLVEVFSIDASEGLSGSITNHPQKHIGIVETFLTLDSLAPLEIKICLYEKSELR